MVSWWDKRYVKACEDSLVTWKGLDGDTARTELIMVRCWYPLPADFLLLNFVESLDQKIGLVAGGIVVLEAIWILSKEQDCEDYLRSDSNRPLNW